MGVEACQPQELGALRTAGRRSASVAGSSGTAGRPTLRPRPGSTAWRSLSYITILVRTVGRRGRERTAQILGGETRMRVVFVGEPADGPIEDPTGGPDAIDAAWVTPDQAEQFPMRADRLPALFRYVAGGGPIYPLDLLTFEGAPYLLEPAD